MAGKSKMKCNVVRASDRAGKKKMVKALEDQGLRFNSKTNISVEKSLEILAQMRYIGDDERLRNLAVDLLQMIENQDQ